MEDIFGAKLGVSWDHKSPQPSIKKNRAYRGSIIWGDLIWGNPDDAYGYM